MKISAIAKAVLPASAYNATKRMLGRPVYEPVVAGEKSDDFYDHTFLEDDYWRRHYTQVDDYACWTVVIDRLRTKNSRRVLEIGCGTGQLAAAIDDAGLLDAYCGFDFSAARLGHARALLPHLRFEHEDAFKTDLFETFDYDTAISTEFLEHVEQDLLVISKLRTGTHFLGTVPNYPWDSHVRYFVDAPAVALRYSSFLDDCTAFALPLNSQGKRLFVFTGIRK